MKVSKNVWIAGIAYALVVLAGCGGAGTIGGGTTGGTGGTDSNSLQGTILAPANQVSGALSSRAESLVPVGSASVEVVNLETGDTVGTGTTDANGEFEIKDVPTGVELEIIAKKQLGNGELRLGGIVEVSDEEGTNVIDPDTTVAAEAAKAQLEELRKTDPDAKPGKLAEIAKEIANDRKEQGLPAPNLTDAEKVKEEGRKWLKDKPAVGHYFGKFEGSESGYLVAFIKNDHFMVAAFKAEADNSDDNEVDNILLGKIGDGGVMAGRDEHVTVVGLMVGGVGTGTWKDVDGKSGTWTIKAVTSEIAGIYAGGWVNENGQERHGYLAAVVTDDNSVWMSGKAFDRSGGEGEGDSGDGKGREDAGGNTGSGGAGEGQKKLLVGMVAWGKLNEDGTISFVYGLNDKSTGTGTAQRIENVIKGSVTNQAGDTFYFRASRNFDPFEEQQYQDQ